MSPISPVQPKAEYWWLYGGVTVSVRRWNQYEVTMCKLQNSWSLIIACSSACPYTSQTRTLFSYELPSVADDNRMGTQAFLLSLLYRLPISLSNILVMRPILAQKWKSLHRDRDTIRCYYRWYYRGIHLTDNFVWSLFAIFTAIFR